MSGPATFGDFAQTARRHLAAMPVTTERPNRDIVAGQIRDCNYGLHRILRIMVRYTADLAHMAQPAGDPNTGSQDWWARAVADTRQALQRAVLHSSPGVRRISPLAGRLGAAAGAMAVGRDLLQTHFAIGADGSREPRTEWSGVIDSALVGRALLSELSGWAREIVDRTSHLTSAQTIRSAQAEADQQRFAAVHRSLAAAAAAIDTAQGHAPVQQRDLAQLHAIPVNVLSPRRQPGHTETIAGLCEGITGTAERVRRAFAAAVPEAAWSPELTAASLRQTAASAAVIAHHCQLIQQALADHAPDLSLSRFTHRLRTSARTAGQARQAWLQAAHGWKSIQTDTTKGTASAAVEVADLVVWTGRLAYSDPNWTPGVRQTSAARTGAELASTPAELGLAVDAVRQAASTVVAIAAADYTRIRTAAQTGRLLTPADEVDASPERLRFIRASRYQVTSLLEAYRDAGTTSVQATAVTDQIASHIQDHNLRDSERQRTRQDRTASRQIADRRAGRQLDPASPAGIAEANARPGMPGPVERRLIELGVIDPALLNRGVALDLAASELIDEAAHETASVRWNSAVTGRMAIVSADKVVHDVLARGRREPAAQSSGGVRGGGLRRQAEPGSPQAEP